MSGGGAATPIDVCFLWHMHQPEYTSPRTGRPVLPWVRMHATRAYLDMARVLARRPEVHVTVNFVPSLVRQLEAYVGGLRDEHEVLAEKPTEDWTPAEREEALARFFSVHRVRGVEPRPRYRELAYKRGSGPVPAGAAGWSVAELRDLTALFHMASFGFSMASEEPLVAVLEAKGRGFLHEDVQALLACQRSAAARVLPAWRSLAGRGQVELSSSPFYHPIVPLLIDTETARRAQPGLPLPPRFAWPEDAAAQITRGREAHQRTFWQTPRGMWPPEGSLSPEAVRRYAGAGIEWLCGDEGILWRSGVAGAARGALYQPYQFAGVKLVFRDRELADRIGFAYAAGEAAPAVADVLARVRMAGAEARAHAPGEVPLVTIALDGENAWESYPGSGEPFLTQLHDALATAPDLRTRTLSEALEGRAATPLGELASGSWIDSDFHIWIGDPDKNRAWGELGAARRRVAEAAAGDERSRARAAAALEWIYQAEGSDWFWWFGEPFHSAEDTVFAAIFAEHLKGAYDALEFDPPATLGAPLAHPERHGPRGTQAPLAFIRPRLTGHGRSFYEWHGAGRHDVPRGAAMSAVKRWVERILFGFDQHTLYLRLDPHGDVREELRGGTLTIHLRVVGGASATLELPLAQGGALSGTLTSAGAAPVALELASAKSAFGDVIEVGVPFATLAAAPRQDLEVWFQLAFAGVASARFPTDGYLTIHVPDASFEAEHWSA